MSAVNEIVLNVISGSCSNERLVVVHRQSAGESRLELRQQTWGEGIGWFTQNSVPLETHQLSQLRATLGGQPAECAAATVQFKSSPQGSRPEGAQLRLHAESA